MFRWRFRYRRFTLSASKKSQFSGCSKEYFEVVFNLNGRVTFRSECTYIHFVLYSNTTAIVIALISRGVSSLKAKTETTVCARDTPEGRKSLGKVSTRFTMP